jgi:hypothetical protein
MLEIVERDKAYCDRLLRAPSSSLGISNRTNQDAMRRFDVLHQTLEGFNLNYVYFSASLLGIDNNPLRVVSVMPAVNQDIQLSDATANPTSNASVWGYTQIS